MLWERGRGGGVLSLDGTLAGRGVGRLGAMLAGCCWVAAAAAAAMGLAIGPVIGLGGGFVAWWEWLGRHWSLC